MKKLYWIGWALCPVLFYLLSWVIPNYYTSRFTIARESERPIQREQMLMTEQPGYISPNLARTENAVDEYGYEPILRSDAFIASLFDCRVRTLDGRFDGTCYDYYQAVLNTQFWHHATFPTGTMMETTDSLLGQIAWLTPEQTQVIRMIRQNLHVELDYESRHVTVTYRAEDPMLATMMANHICDNLMQHVSLYEQEKVRRMLTQIRCDSVPMVSHPAFVVLANPSIDYRKTGPHRSIFALVMSLLVWGGAWGWKNRKRIGKYLA